MITKFVGKSVKRELFVCFLLIAGVPMVISGMFLIMIFSGLVSKNEQTSAREQLGQIQQELQSFFDELDKTAVNIAESRYMIAALERVNTLTAADAYTELYGLTENLRGSADFQIYDEEGKCLFSTAPVVQQEQLPTYWGILKLAKARPDAIIYRKTAETPEADSSLQAAKAMINEANVCIGYVVSNMNEEHFRYRIGDYEAGQNGIVLLDHPGKSVYSTGIKSGDTCYSTELSDSEMTLVLYLNSAFTGEMKKTLQLVLGILALMSLMLCMAAAEYLSRHMTGPLNVLVNAMKEVEKGDLDVSLNSSRQDELGQLYHSFDRMTARIKEYLRLQMEQQQKLNDSSIALMQAQLNPHFLYNTLDTMKWVGKGANIPEIEILASDLARILRATISEKKYITLAEEIAITGAYMEIQKIRFNGNFTYDIELPMELEDCIVPKLIIQPIVENAIIHGLKESEDGWIFINIFEEEEKLIIDISDDGCGMSKEMLEILNSHDPNRLKGHIGFFNVDTILRMNYGNDCGLSVQAQEDGGIRVRICLPVRREELPDV